MIFCAVAALAFWRNAEPVAVNLTLTSSELVADGYQRTRIVVTAPKVPRLSILEKRRGVGIGYIVQNSNGTWQADVRAGIVPGTITIQAEVKGAKPATASLQLVPFVVDRESDGTPDALQLDTDSDREAFRRWFTFLAEAQYFQKSAALPVEINDCAALIRYAYREALKAHDQAWTSEARLPLVLGLDSVTKYQYPYTLLGASLFRIKAGAFREADLGSDAFSQFADAKTLQTLNTHFVSRDVQRASAGDLLFFRHEAADMPFHSMIYLGQSRIDDGGERYLLYHTGPDGSDPGEIRRPTVNELSAHPNLGWRPLPSNPTFLGVYRWNILR